MSATYGKSATVAAIDLSADSSQAALGRHLFETAARPSLLLTRTGELLRANAAVRPLFERPATFVIDAMRRLHHLHLGRWTPLALMLAEHAATGCRRFPIVSPALGEWLLTLELIEEPISEYWNDGNRHSVLLATLAPPPADDPIRLRARFGLTAAECRVAALLLRGQTPTQVARATGVRLSTVRTHVQHLYEKTGTRRQAELVCRLVDERLSAASPAERGAVGTDPASVGEGVHCRL